MNPLVSDVICGSTSPAMWYFIMAFTIYHTLPHFPPQSWRNVRRITFTIILILSILILWHLRLQQCGVEI